MHFLLTYVHVFVSHITNVCIPAECMMHVRAGAELCHVKEPPFIKEQLKNRPGSLL